MSITNDDYFIGVDIGLQTICLSKITCKASLLDTKKIAAPQPLSPGAATVEICEAVRALDPLKKNKGIGVLLPLKAATNSRSVDKIIGLSGWLNVPLADWLEIRLKTEVTILEFDEKNLDFPLSRESIECCENCFRRAFIAAYLASQYFNCIDYCEVTQ